MHEPLTPDEYAARLDQIDGIVQRCEPYRERLYGVSEDASTIAGAINDLTDATRAVAMSLRLLATPPPVETRAQGTFVVVDDETDREELT